MIIPFSLCGASKLAKWQFFKLKIAIFFCLFLLAASNSHAHFGVLVPSSSMVMGKDETNIKVQLAFSHPFSQNGLNMEKPAEFFVDGPAGKINLLEDLKPSIFMDHKAWETDLAIARPGVWQLAFVPQPYFEASEDCYIIHYTKTIIGSFGAEEGWDKALGLPMEIIPLTRPFANYAGNLFSGTVLRNGKILPNADVEIEFLNSDGRHVPENAYFETQVVHTDQNGNFNFAVPWPGWWGFAALSEADEKIEHDGEPRAVETGAVIWVFFSSPKIK